MTDLDAATTTRPAPPELLQPCGYCTGNIIWINLVSGPWRTFEPVEVFTASAPAELLEQRGFALHRRTRLGVALSTLHAWPDWVLITHVCTAYRLALEDSRTQVDHWGDTAPAAALAGERFGEPKQTGRERSPTPARRRAAGVQKGRGASRGEGGGSGVA